MTSPLDSIRWRRTTLVHKICHQVPLCNLWAFPQKLGITKFRHGNFLLVFLKHVVAKKNRKLNLQVFFQRLRLVLLGLN